MTENLKRLIEAVRVRPPMTATEKEEYRLRWVYGNLAIEDPGITLEMVKAVDLTMKAR